jgi:molybdopterin molybdotransferase
VARQASLLSVEDARARILDHFIRLEAEHVPLDRCLGRVLAEPVTSSVDIPPFANSSMDGFALRSESTAGAGPKSPVSLSVADNIPAGSFSARELGPGESARIMTGAPLPPGADAVVPFEDVEDLESKICLSAPVPEGASVRPAGQDVKAGASVVPSGTELNSRGIALLAALGMGLVPVVRRPVVAILSTGDELVRPGTPLKSGQIYDSNSAMLLHAVTEAGGMPLVLPTVRDDAEEISETIASVSQADLLLTTGGASVGDFDYMKDVIGRGGELNFWRVRVRPGKPLLFGSIGSLRIIGLPGNPTSGMVTFEQFARPAIRRMLGAALYRPTVRVRLDERIDNRGGRRTYARARLRYEAGEFHASLSGPQDSAMLSPLARADGLVIVPEDRDELAEGEMALMQVWRLPDALD